MQRRTGARRHAAIAVALAAHLALLGAMALGLLSPDSRTLVAPPPPFVALDLTPAQPRRAPAASPPRTGPPPPRATGAAAAPTPSPTPSPPPGPAAPARPAIGAGPAASEPIGPAGPIGAQAAVRTSTGCDSADFVRLTPAEQARCAERNRRLRMNPKTYAAVDPGKKDFFDGACKKDDDWCRYYKGEGPYPGILALGRKKKQWEN